METHITSYTTYSCQVVLSPDEQFIYKRSRFSRSRRITSVTLLLDHGRERAYLFYGNRDSDVDYTLCEGNLRVATIPGLPKSLRDGIAVQFAKLHKLPNIDIANVMKNGIVLF